MNMKLKATKALLYSIILLCLGFVFFELDDYYSTPNPEDVGQTINDRYLQLTQHTNTAEYSFQYDSSGNVTLWNTDEVQPPPYDHKAPVYYDGTNLYLSYQVENTIYLTSLVTRPKVKNNYFVFKNPPWLKIADQWEVSHVKTDILIPIKAIHDNLYLVESSNHILGNLSIYLLALLLICCYLLLKSAQKNKLFIGILLHLLFFLVIQIPPFATAEVCSPAILAFSSLFNSLASYVVINSLIAVVITYLVLHIIPKLKKRTQSYFTLAIFQLLAFYFGYTIIQLITNSTIPFDITHPLTLNGYSVIGLLGIIPLMLALKFVFLKLTLTKNSSIEMLVSILLILCLGYALNQKYLVLILWPTIVLLAYAFLPAAKTKSIFGLLLLLFSCAILCSHLFIKHSFLTKEKDQKAIAEQLVSSEDPILAYILEEYLNEANTYSNMTRAKEHITLYLSKQSYLNKYHVTYTESFQNIPHNTFNFENKKQYVLHLKTDTLPNLICQFETKLVPNHLGFPELLIAGNNKFLSKLNQFEFAQYQNGYLMQQFGETAFPTHLIAINTDSISKKHVNNQIIVEANNGTHQVVVSIKLPSFGEKLSVFSFFTLSFLLLLIVPQWIGNTNLNSISNKLRSVLIITLVGALAAFAIGSWQFIVSQQNKKNSALLIEKANSVLTELSHKVDNYESLTPEMNEFLTNYLVKFSNVFYTDITLFNPKGKLLASSRDELFSKKLKNKLMHPTAYAGLTKNHQSIFIQNEHIGTLNYLSVYLPFRNKNNELLAYLNLPYFAKQNILDSELSGFLTAMLNLFLLLLSATLLISLTLANSLTKPLRWLQQSLLQIDLSKNKPLQYPGNNEISELIHIYNSKVRELEAKAEILAETERNSAWKEMAKQVAHEIKNPLTPMKLQIQYLQLTLKQGKLEKDKIEKTASSLIEQIDTLAKIADEFAHFSNLKAINLETFDIVQLVTDVTNTFQQEQIETTLEKNIASFEVKQDKSQLVRVLNNVVKNAIQAFDSSQKNKVIHTLINISETNVVIIVSDNAGGINALVKNHIFEPKFTTKSHGMGLGLAMCKTILTHMNGEIWFKDNDIGGTDFHISFPI
jgi:two-component system nitrogen regulation sensor histidine kinase NtrY